MLLDSTRRRAGTRRGLTLVGVAIAVIALLAIVPAVALGAPRAAQSPAAQSATTHQRGDIVSFGDDVVLRAGETADTILVFGGDATIAGTVRHTVATFGGDVHLRKTAVVGSQATKDDPTLVTVGGAAFREPGATVTGRTTADGWSGAVNVEGLGSVVAAVIIAAAIVLWITFTLLALIVAGIVALIWWLVARNRRRPTAPMTASPLAA